MIWEIGIQNFNGNNHEYKEYGYETKSGIIRYLWNRELDKELKWLISKI